MRILFDSKSKLHKTPFGCIRPGEKCTLCLHIPVSCRTVGVSVHFSRDDSFSRDFAMIKTKTENQYEYFTAEVTLDECGLYFYYFNIETPQSSFKLMKFGDSDTNIEDGTLWQVSCIPSDYTVADKFKGRVMYQIFPDRFFKYGDCCLDSKLEPYRIHGNTDEMPDYLPDGNGKILNNDFYGGNLKGIEQKLDYLQRFGVGIIYLNPVFMAYSNHRYDTCDYKKIDPMLGTEDDFVSLCDAAHRRGMSIILDGVFSHTGCDSVYFDKYNRFGGGAYNNPDSPYRSWYDFKNYPTEYTSWWGIDTLPCINESDPGYIGYILTDEDSVVKHWLRLGADGFRLDVADELPDEFISLLRKTVKSVKKDAIVLGEVWEDASNKIAYDIRRRYFTEPELDSVMNYPFRNSILALLNGTATADEFASQIMTIAENYPSEVLNCLMNSLSTHDTARIFTTLTGADMNMTREQKADYVFTDGERQRAQSLLKTAVFLQFFLPGCACIYYGDEICMEGFNDPFNRGFFNWNNTENETSDFYGRMAHLKNTLEPLKTGDIRFLTASDGVLVMERRTGCRSVSAAVNLSGQSVKIESGKFHITHNCTCLEESVYVQRGGFALYE